MNGPVLVCFAVAQEARPFRKAAAARRDIHVLISGMGVRNAERAVRAALEKLSPVLVLTCGFAGGLNPALRVGDLVFDAQATDEASAREFTALGARPAVFHCAERIAITVADKSALRAKTGADAVEMESKIIHAICAERGVECLTLRVISDSAEEDLPLDFNALMTSEHQLSAARLAGAILRSPGRIPALLRLGRNSSCAARELSRALESLLNNRQRCRTD